MKLKKDTLQRLIITYNDAPIVQIGNTVNLSGALVISDGSEFKPSIVFQSNRNAGIYFNSNVIQFTTPIKSPEIFSEAITFGSSKLIQTNNSFSLSNKDHIILDVKDDKLYIPDVYTDAINNFIYLTHAAIHIDGSLSSEVLTFDKHPDHFIKYDNQGITFTAKNNEAIFTCSNFYTPLIISEEIVTPKLVVQKIETHSKFVEIENCSINSLLSSSITCNEIKSDDLKISNFSTSNIKLKSLTFEGPFRTVKSSIESDGSILVLKSFSGEIVLGQSTLKNEGLNIQSSIQQADTGTFRYNPLIDNMEFKSKNNWVKLDQTTTIDALKEEIRVLRTELNELKDVLTAHISALNT